MSEDWKWLDQWEEHATDPAKCYRLAEQVKAERILHLISVVKVMRSALVRIQHVTQAKDDYTTAYVATQALARCAEGKAE